MIDGKPFALPMKYLAAGALVFDEQGRVLLVKPTYKDGWEIPGGIVEADESPKQACIREISEELGLTISIGPLLALDYLPRTDRRSESVQLIFDGGTLARADIETIRLPAAELSEFRFLAPDAALGLLEESLRRRVAGSLRARSERHTVLLHDGLEA